MTWATPTLVWQFPVEGVVVDDVDEGAEGSGGRSSSAFAARADADASTTSNDRINAILVLEVPFLMLTPFLETEYIKVSSRRRKLSLLYKRKLYIMLSLHDLYGERGYCDYGDYWRFEQTETHSVDVSVVEEQEN
jgi:hypothetical protein